MTKNTKNKTNRSLKRDVNGRFVQGNNLRKGSIYLLTTEATPIPVRVINFTSNRLAVVQHGRSLFGLVKPQNLQKMSRAAVRDYLDAI